MTGKSPLSPASQEAKNATRAIERMAGYDPGPVVLEENSDSEQEIYAEPRASSVLSATCQTSRESPGQRTHSPNC